MESKASFWSSLCNLRPLLGAVYEIEDLIQEQFVQSKTSYRSSLLNLIPFAEAVCGILYLLLWGP